jgi:F-type H+-transporting ATPase subunit c
VSIKMLAVVGAFVGIMVFSWAAMAQPEAEVAGQTAMDAGRLDDGSVSQPEADRAMFVALAIGLGLGLAAAGGGLGQGRATAAAVEGLSRNPGSYDKVFTPFILGLVLIESLVIYSLVISLILLGNLSV